MRARLGEGNIFVLGRVSGDDLWIERIRLVVRMGVPAAALVTAGAAAAAETATVVAGFSEIGAHLILANASMAL